MVAWSRRTHSPASSFDRLLVAARRGEDSAWAQLYAEFAGPLLGYLRGQGAEDPEDLVGEVFLQVVRGLGSFSGDGAAFRAWVFTIAHHRMVDERRARSRRTVEPASDERLEAILPPATLEPEVVARLDTEEVVALLDGLTDDQREVLLLRLVGGLTTAEVADATGRDPEAVKGLAKRGLAGLRRRIARTTANPPPDGGLRR